MSGGFWRDATARRGPRRRSALAAIRLPRPAGSGYIRSSLSQLDAMPATKRVLYSIRAEVLDRFNAAFKPTQRSKVIERLMLEAIEGREDRVALAAAAIAADEEALTDHRELSDWVDAQSAHAADLG